jgi:hypothetical protein
MVCWGRNLKFSCAPSFRESNQDRPEGTPFSAGALVAAAWRNIGLRSCRNGCLLVQQGYPFRAAVRRPGRLRNFEPTGMCTIVHPERRAYTRTSVHVHRYSREVWGSRSPLAEAQGVDATRACGIAGRGPQLPFPNRRRETRSGPKADQVDLGWATDLDVEAPEPAINLKR